MNTSIAKHIVILSGPSGAGEDSVITELAKTLPVERVLTTTTRPLREGEFQGNPYYFVSRDTFEAGIRKGDFVEWAEEYNSNLYGVTATELDRVAKSGKIGLWKIEWKGVITAKKLYPGIIAIFLMTENLTILEKRIRNRNPNVSDAYIRERMDYTKEWLEHQNIYDYTVINKENRLEEAVVEIRNILESRGCSSM